MADKNMKRISDEELKEVNGGGRVGGAGRACTRSINRDRFVEEAKKRLDPKDPLTINSLFIIKEKSVANINFAAFSISP